VYPETFFTVIEERDIRHWFRRKVPSEARNLRIIRGNPARLSFPQDSYDLVGCQFLLTLPLDPDPVISEAIRVCAPGGTVLLQDLAGPSTEPWFAAAQSDPVMAEIDKVLRELQTVLFFGSMLNGTMEKYGMENLKVSVQSCPDGDYWKNSIEHRLWTHKLHKVVPIALTRVDDDRSTEELIEAFLELINPKDASSQSVMCSITGQKPFPGVLSEPTETE
jgi:ubiquinone/menaquinone biosynthesis C-methylase UbiE